MAGPKDPVKLILVGNEHHIHTILQRHERLSCIETVHAPEVIGMDELGPVAVRKKREASLNLAMRLLAEGRADAVVSAGNTGAIVAAAKHHVGLISGLRRPALAVPLPTPNGRVLLLDAGAHSEANAIQLAQSAALAHVYLQAADDRNKPRVGLLNIGHEPGKGKKQVRRAFTLLGRSQLNFIGNIEPQELFGDRADAAVCEGFVGNVVLKMVEGLSESLLHFLKDQAEELSPERAGMPGLPELLRRFRDMYHYQSVGGAPLLGVRGVVVIGHGRSKEAAVVNAIALCVQMVKANIVATMTTALEQDQILADLKHQYTLMMLDHLRNPWGFSKS